MLAFSLPDMARSIDMNPLTDMQLLQRISQRDEDALLKLHERYANLVFSVALRVVNDNQTAEEVTQDTFMRLWNRALSYDPQKGKFITWLLTMTRHIAIDAIRSRQRREPRAGMLYMDEDPALWENILSDGSNDLRRTLEGVLRNLPGDQRDLIEMAYFFGLSHSEIAEERNIPLGTVKTRIRLGMQKLRQAWLGAGGNPTDENLA
jgi:RNA polymerase sigma-70 factor (ECF subfamily)